MGGGDPQRDRFIKPKLIFPPGLGQSAQFPEKSWLFSPLARASPLRTASPVLPILLDRLPFQAWLLRIQRSWVLPVSKKNKPGNFLLSPRQRLAAPQPGRHWPVCVGAEAEAASRLAVMTSRRELAWAQTTLGGERGSRRQNCTSRKGLDLKIQAAFA